MITLLPGPIGAPFAPFYASWVALRRLAFDRGWLATAGHRLPTFSVGALEAGGSGKTPVARWLLRHLVSEGHRPGLLSRGYGRPTRELVIRHPGEPPLAEAIGDEPAMIARSIDVPVAVFGDRRRAAEALASSADVDCFVLDDAFAHRRFRRDLDIVVLRATPLPYQQHMLPWGMLRESATSLERADVVWIVARADDDSDAVMRYARGLRGKPLIISSTARLEVDEQLLGRSVILATAVAHGEQVERTLRHAGVEVAATVFFPDHHRFASRDVVRINELSTRKGDLPIVVTAKDAVKLQKLTMKFSVINLDIIVSDRDRRLLSERLENVFCAKGEKR